MDKTPKERIVFDEGVYYGDEGSEISIEDITSREGITVEEVLEGYTKEQIFENAMEMMDIDRTEELDGLRAFFDGSDNPLSSYDNPLGGNRIIARGSIGRWDGTRHGLTVYRDFETGENRDLSADEMSRVADYFTEVSKPGSGIEEVIAIRMGQRREEARSEDGRVTLKGEAQASRAASEKLAEGRDTGSPAREDPSIV